MSFIKDLESGKYDLCVEEAWLSRKIGLHPRTSMDSMDSLSTIEDDENPSKNIGSDYHVYAEKDIPTLEEHKQKKHTDMHKDCPWCNRHFFNWLCERGHVSFIKPIVTEEVVLPPPFDELALKQAKTIEGNFEQAKIGQDNFVRRPFRYLADMVVKWLPKKNHTPQYHERRTKDYHEKKYKTIIDRITSKTHVETAMGKEHGTYKKLPRGGQEGVRTLVKSRFEVDPKKMESYPAHNNLFVGPSPDLPLGPDDPKYLIMRFDDVVKLQVQQRLWFLWKKMRDRLKKSERKKHRDEWPQIHVGMWQHYVLMPHLTWDTMNQDKDVNVFLAAFLTVLKEKVSRACWGLLNRYDPKVLEKHIKAGDYIRTHPELVKELELSPYVDFGGIFFTAAIKEGGSQRIHLDWMDHPGTYAWVITIGPGWEGGELCFPQLGKKVPTKSGQVIAFQGRYLAHFAAPNTGERLVITGFTDRALMKSALERVAQDAGVIPGGKRNGKRRISHSDDNNARAKKARKITPQEEQVRKGPSSLNSKRKRSVRGKDNKTLQKEM